jgi:L-threonylcarbamoyladenylate synthase
MSRTIKCKDMQDHSLTRDSLDEIREIYTRGELFVYPTETLYGLGADPFNETAIKRLYKVKRRPIHMPVSIAVSNIEMMENLGEVNDTARTIAEKFLPGPVTVLLKGTRDVPGILKKEGSVAVRIPNHPVALGIIEITGPITATSANIHGEKEPLEVGEAIDQLGDDVRLYIDCGESRLKGPSTIVDCTGASISIIRKGVIPEKEIRVLFD